MGGVTLGCVRTQPWSWTESQSNPSLNHSQETWSTLILNCVLHLLGMIAPSMRGLIWSSPRNNVPEALGAMPAHNEQHSIRSSYNPDNGDVSCIWPNGNVGIQILALQTFLLRNLSIFLLTRKGLKVFLLPWEFQLLPEFTCAIFTFQRAKSFLMQG